MIVIDKPPLDEDLLVHFGVKGMRWGRRKDSSSGGSSDKKPMSTKKKVAIGAGVAVAAAGAAAVAYMMSGRGKVPVRQVMGNRPGFKSPAAPRGMPKANFGPFRGGAKASPAAAAARGKRAAGDISQSEWKKRVADLRRYCFGQRGSGSLDEAAGSWRSDQPRVSPIEEANMIAADKPPLKEAYLSHISVRPWSTYSEADYTPEQWHNACLIHQHDGAPTSKALCKLPVRTPNGALNKNGVHAAVAALHGARTPLNATEEQKDAARQALIRLYRELGESPPPSLNHSDPDDDILEHFGVKGMRWGQRKNAAPSNQGHSGKYVKPQAGDTHFVITRQQKIATVAAVGATATAAILYKSGNLKSASIGTSKLALEGTKLAGSILFEGGKFAVRSTAKVASFTAKTAWSAAAGTVRVGKGLVSKTPDVPVQAPKGRVVARVANLLKRRPRG